MILSMRQHLSRVEFLAKREESRGSLITTTHDTRRGEFVRARVSPIPSRLPPFPLSPFFALCSIQLLEKLVAKMESKWKGTTTAREDRSWKRPPFLSCPRGMLFTITSGTQEATILLSLTRVSPRNKFTVIRNPIFLIIFFRYLEKFLFRIFNRKKKILVSFFLERMLSQLWI